MIIYTHFVHVHKIHFHENLFFFVLLFFQDYYLFYYFSRIIICFIIFSGLLFVLFVSTEQARNVPSHVGGGACCR